MRFNQSPATRAWYLEQALKWGAALLRGSPPRTSAPINNYPGRGPTTNQQPPNPNSSNITMCKINCSGGCPDCAPEDHLPLPLNKPPGGQIFYSGRDLHGSDEVYEPDLLMHHLSVVLGRPVSLHDFEFGRSC